MPIFFLFLTLFLVFGIEMVGGIGNPLSKPVKSTSSSSTSIDSQSLHSTTYSTEQTLQMRTLEYSSQVITPTPPPPQTPLCGHNNFLTNSCVCNQDIREIVVAACPDMRFDPVSLKCQDDGSIIPGSINGDKAVCFWFKTDPAIFEKYKNQSGCGELCYGKPVIYLYPEKTTMVDVKLTIPGKVTISDPEYPDTGWKNVLAHPSGRLEYLGKTYKELYYETQVTQHIVPQSGVFIPRTNLKQSLISYTSALGLQDGEQQEFLEYWLPKLNESTTKYVFFSVLTPIQKELVDHVTISPKPDTFIEFLVYFKPVDEMFAIKPLAIPPPPARKGFTAVEWGGTIDSDPLKPFTFL